MQPKPGDHCTPGRPGGERHDPCATRAPCRLDAHYGRRDRGHWPPNTAVPRRAAGKVGERPRRREVRRVGGTVARQRSGAAIGSNSIKSAGRADALPIGAVFHGRCPEQSERLRNNADRERPGQLLRARPASTGTLIPGWPAAASLGVRRRRAGQGEVRKSNLGIGTGMSKPAASRNPFGPTKAY